jgi:prepilin-type processing-associated H-X9-DG protein
VPSWSIEQVKKGAHAADCYPGEMDPYLPFIEVWANYGIHFQMNGDCLTDPDWAGTCDGSEASPIFAYGGSLAYPAEQGGKTTYLPSISRPAELALIGDAYTAVGGGYFAIAVGCEGMEMHQQGGNFVFLDGHAKRISAIRSDTCPSALTASSTKRSSPTRSNRSGARAWCARRACKPPRTLCARFPVIGSIPEARRPPLRVRQTVPPWSRTIGFPPGA